MSAQHQLETLKSLLSHYARNAGPRRVQTSLTEKELLGLQGARSNGSYVAYPHQWHDGRDWQTTNYDLVPK